ncbi:GMP/IMP nucleotidase [Gammaproteobacteria bacterium]|jgi:5'-nucleotidase|nr:GMP/IMP nucleotidase [Gammaproteobacteria bacterium]
MINWSQIDTVLLDMDGTLLDLSFDNFFWREHLPKEYSRQRDVPLGQSRVVLEELSNSLIGTLEWYCVDHWSEVLQIDIEAAKHNVKEQIKFRPHTVKFLKFLNQLNKPCILVTNAHPKTMELKVATMKLHQHLDKVISSHEFLLAKENEGFWQLLEQREGLELSRCLFIDDSKPVLTRAKSEGVGHLLQILHPDLTRPPLPQGEFLAIHDFDELMTT